MLNVDIYNYYPSIDTLKERGCTISSSNTTKKKWFKQWLKKRRFNLPRRLFSFMESPVVVSFHEGHEDRRGKFFNDSRFSSWKR